MNLSCMPEFLISNQASVARRKFWRKWEENHIAQWKWNAITILMADCSLNVWCAQPRNTEKNSTPWPWAYFTNGPIRSINSTQLNPALPQILSIMDCIATTPEQLHGFYDLVRCSNRFLSSVSFFRKFSVLFTCSKQAGYTYRHNHHNHYDHVRLFSCRQMATTCNSSSCCCSCSGSSSSGVVVSGHPDIWPWDPFIGVAGGGGGRGAIASPKIHF